MPSSPVRRLSARAWLLPAVALAAACAAAPPPAPAPAPPEPPPPVERPAEYKNTLRWTTASEVDNFGFDVYRGDSEEGPFERLTESPLAGAGTTDLTTEYVWEDEAIDPHRVYYYYVESISLQGVREQFTPIIRAPAKLTAEGQEASPSPTDDDSGGDGRR
jgi:hypothetical protein